AASDPSKAAGYQMTLTTGTAQQVADREAPAFLNYDLEAGTDDHFTLSVNTKGLLTTATLQSEDQTGAILTSLAGLAGSVSPAPMPAHAMMGAHPAKTRKPDCFGALRNFEYSGNLDLSSAQPAAEVNAAIQEAMFKAPAGASKFNLVSVPPVP